MYATVQSSVNALSSRSSILLPLKLNAAHAVQIMMRQLPANVAEAVAWRSRQKREGDDAWRATGLPARRFTYTSADVLRTCDSFLAEDTSINVLEHIERLGGIPGDEDTEDSDKVLRERMHHGAAAQQTGDSAR